MTAFTEGQAAQLSALFDAMTAYYTGDQRRINHFIKVHAYARQIALHEGLSAEAQFTLEAAALTHDIGIREAERLYGECGGKLQERLGPPEAARMLTDLGFDAAVIDRVCFLIAHHHTLQGVDSIDWQILLEADFLVNMIEDNLSANAIAQTKALIFRSPYAITLLERLHHAD